MGSRIRTERESLDAAFGKRKPARILLEAATESEWVARHLEGLGHEVIVADPNFAPMYASRSHWGIENKLHWVLDVGFREDDCRVRVGYAAQNFAVIRHAALNLLRAAEDVYQKKLSIKSKRMVALSDENYLLHALGLKLLKN